MHARSRAGGVDLTLRYTPEWDMTGAASTASDEEDQIFGMT
eukprot:COSAG02_NODE_9296_length_2264_cov_1.245266_2_plen_41_part_00